MLDQRLREAWRALEDAGGSVLVLTGAGISAESGIPTFRGPQGYWTVGSRNYRPEELATRAAFARFPSEVWRWYLFRRAVCRAAAPNPGHRALVHLEQQFADRFSLVTQNVDGLHLRAGHSPARVFQIHGNIDFMRCAAGCNSPLTPIPAEFDAFGRDTPLAAVTMERLHCDACGGPSRPHVLWFDEYYDEALFFADTAMQRAAQADAVVVVGSSGATNLPMQIGALAVRRGIVLIDINPDENPFGALARVAGGHCVRATASNALPELAGAPAET